MLKLFQLVNQIGQNHKIVVIEIHQYQQWTFFKNYNVYDKMLLNGSYYFDNEIKLTAEIPSKFSNYNITVY